MTIYIGKEKFKSEVLTKPSDLEKGMMGRKKLDGCMVFDIGKGFHSFWMKDCLIPLDIVFVNKGKITKIYLDCPPEKNSKTYTKYTGTGDMVIEFPGNTAKNWKVNDKVTFVKD